jgi:hypothetical protein
MVSTGPAGVRYPAGPAITKGGDKMGQIFVSLSAILLVAVFRSQTVNYPKTAARLPDLIGWVVVLLACLAIVQVLFDWRRQRAAGTLVVFPAPDWRAVGIGGAFLALILIYALSINMVGYLIATPLFMLIPFLILRPIGRVAAIATAGTVTVFIWLVFFWFLRLSIPLFPVF